MINKLIIENFRSIKHVEIDLGMINAFIGPNNAGKSNVMKALNIILGDVYPSIRSFDEKDFHNYDTSNPIKIEVRFGSPLHFNKDVHGFQLTFDGKNCEYLAIDSQGKVVTDLSSGREVRVSNKMKDEVALMYLGLDRQAPQQIRATQWTLYGKLLRHIEKQIDEPIKEQFKKRIKDAYDSHISSSLNTMEFLLKKIVEEQTGLKLSLRLSLIDPIEIIKNLRPYLKENEFSPEFDSEDMGTGTQSALAIGIARAYAEIVKQPLVLAIEEPELYLHPHGCRHFYKLLKDFSKNGVQIIYTTHEKSFVDISNFESIHLLRKEAGETKVYSGAKKGVSSHEEIKMASKFDETINEVFFANYVILEEGELDKIACKIALEKLGIELDKKGISIIDCGGNTAIKPIAEVLNFFKIPTAALLDEDPGNQKTSDIINELRKLLGQNNVFLKSPNLEGEWKLSQKPTKAEAIEIFSKKSESEIPEVYRDIIKDFLIRGEL
ncbi:MAG: AAA family ATPase [Candidatus Nanoarchaeia archaeon]|nr:AAA family ATPase [Candidatus Jingweiarchaeum tengchongense]